MLSCFSSKATWASVEDLEARNVALRSEAPTAPLVSYEKSKLSPRKCSFSVFVVLSAQRPLKVIVEVAEQLRRQLYAEVEVLERAARAQSSIEVQLAAL